MKERVAEAALVDQHSGEACTLGFNGAREACRAGSNDEQIGDGVWMGGALAHAFHLTECMSEHSRMTWGLAVQRDELVRDGEEREFEAGGDAGFVEDVREVAFHGLFANGELFCDVLVTAA